MTVWSPELSLKEYCDCILFFKQGFEVLGIWANFVHVVHPRHIDLEGGCNESIHMFLSPLTYFGFLFYRWIFRLYFPAFSENNRSCCVLFLFNCVLLGEAIDFLLSCLWEIKAVKHRLLMKHWTRGKGCSGSASHGRSGTAWFLCLLGLLCTEGLAQQLCFPALPAGPAHCPGRLLSRLLFTDNFVC